MSRPPSGAMAGAGAAHDTAASHFKTSVARVASATIFPFDAGPSVPASSLYEDSLATPLPTINIRKTLLAKLCRREHDAAFHTSVLALTRRVELFVYAIIVVLVAASLSLFFIADLHVRTLASCVVVASGMIYCVHAAASLLWDVLCLVVPTFDFWFLTGMNAVNTALWCLLFHDVRAAAMFTIGLVLNMAMVVDANAYTRRLSVHLYVLGPPSVFTGLLFVFAQFPPDLHYTTYHVRGVAIDSVDLMANANLTVIYFMMVRGLRSWRLIMYRDPVEVVRCDVFLPVCRLAPQRVRSTASTRSRLTITKATTVSTIRRMRLQHQARGKAIDIKQSLLPSLAHVAASRLPAWILNTVGVVGWVCSMASIVWKVISVAYLEDARGTAPVSLTIVGFVASALFVVVHTAHFQPRLAQRVLLEIDAWYMSFQITTTTLSMCDIIDWQPVDVLLFLPPLVWCHWTIFLDALPAIPRRRLGCSRRLIVVVTLLLMLYPVLLSYYVYYSPARPFLRNRVLLEIGFGDTQIRMENFGFLASKLFMLFVWTARSLWRELSRPADAFKFIELNAYYNVNVV